MTFLNRFLNRTAVKGRRTSPTPPRQVQAAGEDPFDLDASWAAVGFGKTSGSVANCVKDDERKLWERYARETGRSDSIIIVSPSQEGGME